MWNVEYGVIWLNTVESTVDRQTICNFRQKLETILRYISGVKILQVFLYHVIEIEVQSEMVPVFSSSFSFL